MSMVSSSCASMSRVAPVSRWMEAIGEGRLAVVDVGDDGEVADQLRVVGDPVVERLCPLAGFLVLDRGGAEGGGGGRARS